ncbi:MAG: response regulator [Terriglobales bacterium]
MSLKATAHVAIAKKKVLLVHGIGPRRDLRASIMRKRGCEVVCADDCAEARMLWHPSVYDLVLLDGRRDGVANQELCREMKTAHPDERVAFLVGKPELLSAKAATDGRADGEYQRLFRELLSEACEVLPHRHGFMEAVWRMHLMRSTLPSSNTVRLAPADAVSSVPDERPPINFGDAVRQIELEAGAAE